MSSSLFLSPHLTLFYYCNGSSHERPFYPSFSSHQALLHPLTVLAPRVLHLTP